jgi:catechol 2,3-dioxygenase
MGPTLLARAGNSTVERDERNPPLAWPHHPWSLPMALALDPPRPTGPFEWAPTLGIERAHYIAVHAQDPAVAARFAVEHMGFHLVHADGEGRHYLAANGLDAYSLVYTPGRNGETDHISYLCASTGVLADAATRLEAAGVAVERVPASPLWRHGPAVRFRFTNGTLIELSTGVNVTKPMGYVTPLPKHAPGPISFDHAIVRARDLAAGYAFTNRHLGFRESGRIVNPAGIPVLGFFRCHTLYHCFGLAHSPQADGLHHFQMTLKDSHAVIEAYEAMKAGGQVELLWGPLRHGAGQNCAFYFHDAVGNVVEYSAEEELILDEDTYVPRAWSTADWRPTDEWNRTRAPWAAKH